MQDSELAGLMLQLQAQQQLQGVALSAAGYGGAGASGSSHGSGNAQTGVVRAWYDEKGFGFIAPDNGGQDVFIHRKQLGEGMSLLQGTPVQFELDHRSSSGKPAASRITVLGHSPSAALAAAVTQLSSLTRLAAPGPAAMPAPPLGGKGLGKGGAEPSDNLFICGLPLDTTEDRMKQIFSAYGQVQTMRLLPDVAGKPDKSALVRMGDVTQASWMVDNLNGNIPQGLANVVTVRFADNRAQKARELGLPKPGEPGGYGVVPRASALPYQRSSPYLNYGEYNAPGGQVQADGGFAMPPPAPSPAPDGGFAATAAAAAGNPGIQLLAALAQLQQLQGAVAPAAPAANAGQSLQELLQDLQNLQGLTGSLGTFGGLSGVLGQG